LDEIPENYTLDKLPESNSKVNLAQLKDLGLGAGVALAGGGAAFGTWRGAKKLWEKPLRELRPIEKNLSKTIADYSLGKVGLKDIPSELSKSMKNFETKVLNPHIDKLSMDVKTKTPKMFNEVFNNYRSGLDGFDMALEESGMKLNKSMFKSNVITKTIEDLKLAGYSEQDLSKLSEVGKSIGKGTDNLNISQAKGYFNKLKGAGGGIESQLYKNWGSFLEEYAPAGTKEGISKLNSSYKPIAELRNTVYNLSKQGEGAFRDKGIYNYFREYGLGEGQELPMKSMGKLLSEGNELMSPNPGLAEKFKILEDLRSKRINYKTTINKSGTLLKEADELVKQHPYRTQSLGKTIMGGAVKQSMKSLLGGLFSATTRSIGGGIIESKISEPAMMATFGTSDPLEVIGRALGNKKPSKEEFDRWLEQTGT